jgi:PhzF family phenazine biosynthesis protein
MSGFMTRSLPVFQVDAFTRRCFTGNPAAVVLEADGLDAGQMQLIARELNVGDTAFVLRPDGDDHDLRVRFFTPRAEAAFVGHATVAVHAVLTELGRPAAPRQKQKTGIVRVSACRDGDSINVGIEQPPPKMRGAPTPAQLSAVLAALGLAADELDARAPPVIAGENSTRLMLALRDAAVLARLQPDLPRLKSLSGELAAPGFFLYTLRPALPDCATEARMFCPAIGINEDPVSGNAHGMLGAWLWQQGLLTPHAATGIPAFIGAQGHHLQRPGRVSVALAVTAGTLDGVCIGGDAVVVLKSTLTL